MPSETISHEYELEYGTDRIEIHTDAISKDEKVLVADDLLATGGTAVAACELINRLGGSVVECCFLIDLTDLGGRKALEDAGNKVFALLEF